MSRYREFLADLHIHTALSPCASPEMSPPAIVEAALEKGLAMIAICDHNVVGNVVAVQQAAKGRLAVLAGVEITTSEEVHVLGMFGSAAQAQRVADEIRATLPDVGADYYQRFGEQLLMDANGKVVARETKVLIAASGFTLSRVVKLITAIGGLAVPSHVDRPSYSITSQLGVFPTDVKFDAVEVSPLLAKELSPNGPVSGRRNVGHGNSHLTNVDLPDLPVVASSDSHFLSDIGSVCTVVKAKDASFDELKLALAGVAQRSVVIRA